MDYKIENGWIYDMNIHISTIFLNITDQWVEVWSRSFLAPKMINNSWKKYTQPVVAIWKHI